MLSEKNCRNRTLVYYLLSIKHLIFFGKIHLKLFCFCTLELHESSTFASPEIRNAVKDPEVQCNDPNTENQSKSTC